jgi:hypothetical protein
LWLLAAVAVVEALETGGTAAAEVLEVQRTPLSST